VKKRCRRVIREVIQPPRQCADRKRSPWWSTTDLKRHEHYEKPGDRKRRKTREAIRRRRRQAARVMRVRGGA